MSIYKENLSKVYKNKYNMVGWSHHNQYLSSHVTAIQLLQLLFKLKLGNYPLRDKGKPIEDRDIHTSLRGHVMYNVYNDEEKKQDSYK